MLREVTAVSFASREWSLPRNCLRLSAMSTNGPERFGEVVHHRRIELGLSQMQVWNQGGPSNTTLTVIENGRLSDLTPATAKKLDRGLQWMDGGALRLWRDGVMPEPYEAESRPGLLQDRVEARRRPARFAGIDGYVEALGERLTELEERVAALEDELSQRGGDGDAGEPRGSAPTKRGVKLDPQDERDLADYQSAAAEDENSGKGSRDSSAS